MDRAPNYYASIDLSADPIGLIEELHFRGGRILMSYASTASVIVTVGAQAQSLTPLSELRDGRQSRTVQLSAGDFIDFGECERISWIAPSAPGQLIISGLQEKR